ncbi:MAG TPA: transglycosylase SLT domain-containing protein [Pyrinomonadaceae bacterium]|nr:transglycosylase SLT domain-containing protein [Pyrinomonadaceae bacterium]
MISSIARVVFATFLTLVLFTFGCSGQTEDQALANLRQMAIEDRIPTDDYLAGIESRFSGRRGGLLAKLLRAKIRFDNRDFAGAASILNTPEFQTKTKLADYAMWLRGRALQEAGDHASAMKTFEELLVSFPDSIHATDARLKWAASAIRAGQAPRVPEWLKDLSDARKAEADLLIAEAYDAQGNASSALASYRRAYFYGAGTDAATKAQAKLTSLGQPLTPQSADEAFRRAELLIAAKDFAGAERSFADLNSSYPSAITPAIRLRHLSVFSNLRKTAEAQNVFNAIPSSAKEKEEAYYQLVMAYARARQWAQARTVAEEMRAKFASGRFTPKAWVDAGMAARDAKIRVEEQSFLRSAVAAFPNAVEVAGAQFELAWLEHDNKNVALSSQMLTEHLARYAERDTTNRGKAGYWAARDSERAGKTVAACALYDGVTYRYSANWYGYLAQQRLAAMSCPAGAAVDPLVARAVAALKTITVAPETATAKELARAEKSAELSLVGLFDWAIDELKEAKRTAENSPTINLALAKHYRLKGDNVNALLSLAKSYPDYSQMFPEEMGREEWDIFYPLTHWDQIKAWAKNRNLDEYQVAGLIRQESVFNPRAKSHANAYGLMQLLIPTARATARKYGSSASITADSLFQPATNIELGTAYMRDQFDKFGRIEYVAVAYNAGPGRVSPWRASLPIEIDEFVEAIPFRETKGYVQGVIRNSAQYRRLYDSNGNFKPNVGARPVRSEIDTKAREEVAAQFPDVRVGTGGEEE